MPGAPIKLATYNILAPSYVRPEWYVEASLPFLSPERRLPALVQHLEALDCDLLCLQEVEADWFTAIQARLASAGYEGRLAQKGAGKPDGCAAFFRTDR